MEALEDDDFGELYADVEPPNAIADFSRHYTQPEPEEEEEEQPPDSKSSQKDIVDDSVSAESSRSSVKDDDFIGSDSDDDLKIVLNDDDCADFAVPVGSCDDEDADADDHLPDADESLTKNGGYASRFLHRKYTRTQGSMLVNNMKANKSMGMASYSSLSNKGRWNGDACFQHLASSSSHVTRMCSAGNPMMVRCGYGSSLPWNWSIFDVNVDTLNEKPWRVPGVDITDYFNFDFNENTWKLYCVSLEQLWRTSVQTGIPIDESAKVNEETMREQTDKVASGIVLNPWSNCELPKGRPILVEDSMGERQPSVDVRRPRSRDPDVIIQIKVHESSDYCSGSGNSIVIDGSLEGESTVGNNKNILNSQSDCDDVLSEDQLEDVKKSAVSSAQERNGLILGVDEDKHQDQADQHPEDTAQVPGGEIKAGEDVGKDTCSADPCWIESELSLGDQELSLTSYPDSDSEATENSVHVDNEKSHTPLRRQSVNSVIDLKESLALYSKNSKNDNFNTKPVDVDNYSRNKGPLRKEWRHQRGRHRSGSNLNSHIENDNADSSIHMSSARDLSLLGNQFVDYDERLQDFGNRKRRDVLYNRETKQSCYYGSEKFVDSLVQTVRTKYSYREEQESFRENTNRYDRRIVDERNYFFEPRSPMEHSENRERDWGDADWGYYADDLSPNSYRESRPFLPKHSSFPAKERYTRRRRRNDESHFRDRDCKDDFNECEFEFHDNSYKMSTYSAEREMKSLDDKHEERFLHIHRDRKRFYRGGRHHNSTPLFFDNLWSEKMEDKYLKYTHNQTSNFRECRQSSTDSARNCIYGTRLNENFGDCRRHKNATDNRSSDWPFGYIDAAEDEDFIISPVEEYQFYESPSEVLDWTEDETMSWHHETHAASLHTTVQIDDIKLQQHQLNMPRRGSKNCLKESSKIMCSGKRGQAVLKCRTSADFVNWDGKSDARSSRVLRNGKFENVDQMIAKKRKAFVDFDEYRKKGIKFSNSESDNNHENKKRIQNVPEIRQGESSDIEEGQIVPEEYEEPGAAPNDSVKKIMSQIDDNSDQFIGGYDSQRILDSLAKMEKRRERFKQPIATKKEAEESLKLNNDSIVDPGEMKQPRPARRRRWVGS